MTKKKTTPVEGAPTLPQTNTVRVRALQSFVTFGDGGRPFRAGQEYPLAAELAASLARGGLVEYVEVK